MHIINKIDIGLYRDVGVIIVRNWNGGTTDKIGKQKLQIFNIGSETDIKSDINL